MCPPSPLAPRLFSFSHELCAGGQLTQFSCVTAEVFDEGNGRRFAAPARAGQKRAGRERAAHPGLKAQKMGRTMLRRIAKSVLAAGLAVALAVSPALSCTGIMLKTT